MSKKRLTHQEQLAASVRGRNADIQKLQLHLANNPNLPEKEREALETKVLELQSRNANPERFLRYNKRQSNTFRLSGSIWALH